MHAHRVLRKAGRGAHGRVCRGPGVQLQAGGVGPAATAATSLPQALGCLFFAAACLLYKAPAGPSHSLEPSLPSQSSASDTPADDSLPSQSSAAHSGLQLQSDI